MSSAPIFCNWAILIFCKVISMANSLNPDDMLLKRHLVWMQTVCKKKKKHHKSGQHGKGLTPRTKPHGG